MLAKWFFLWLLLFSIFALSEKNPLAAAKLSERSLPVSTTRKRTSALSARTAPTTHRQLKLSSLRVQELIPTEWHLPLGLQLGVPDNFIPMPFYAGNKKEKMALLTYWGEAKAVKLYYSEKMVIAPIFLAIFSLSKIKNGFLTNLEKDQKLLSYSSITHVQQTTRGSWDSHRYLLGTGRYAGRTVPILWLESPLNHHCCIIVCLSPKDGEKAAEALWERFLKKTEELPGENYYRAMGLDIRPGITTYRFAGYTMILESERRERDGTVVLVASTEPPGLLSTNFIALMLDEEKQRSSSKKISWGCCLAQMLPKGKNEKDGYYFSGIFLLPKQVKEFSEHSQTEGKKPFDVKAFSAEEQISIRNANSGEKLSLFHMDF